MPITIRKAERITIWESTSPVVLNQDSFKLLIENEPYLGKTDQEFYHILVIFIMKMELGSKSLMN